MKRLICLAAWLPACLSLSAQVISKGEKFFGGSFYAGANQLEYDFNLPTVSSTHVGIVPSLSWAIRDNRTIGFQTGFSFAHTRNTDGLPEYRETTGGIAPGVFLVSYKELGKRFGFDFRHTLAGTYGWIRRKNIGPDYFFSRSWGAWYAFTPEVFYRFSDRFLGQASIGAARAVYRNSGGRDFFLLNASFLQNFTIGFQYRVGKRSDGAQ